jgi:L-iditol 2-dehydrogenase
MTAISGTDRPAAPIHKSESQKENLLSVDYDIPKTSRAAVLSEFGKPLTIRDVPIPETLEPGALLVRIETASICGSDIHLSSGALAASSSQLPVILGHEMVGTVVAFSEGSEKDSIGEDLAIGDRIVFAHSSCGRCHHCTVTHQRVLCTERQLYMFTSCAEAPHLLGGFSEYCYVMPNSGRLKVPDGVKSEWASASSCALRTVVGSFDRLGKIEPWQTVVIQGTGPLGLFATAMANHMGATRLIVIGGPDGRLQVARSWGATDLISINDVPDASERQAVVSALTRGRGADIVMEFSGGRTAFDEGLDLLADGGRYVVTGQVGAHEVSFRPSRLTRGAWSLLGSYSGDTAEYWAALQFMDATKHKYDFDAMISNEYRLEDINLAMERMAAFQEIKPVIRL